MSYRYRQPKSLRSAQNDFRLWFNANLKEYARDIARQGAMRKCCASGGA